MALARRPLVLIPLLLVMAAIGAFFAAKALVPGLVRSQAQGWVTQNLPGKVLTLGSIAFDPWALKLDIAGIAIADKSAPAAPLVAVRALSVDANIASLWHLSPRLDSVVVDAPAVDAVLERDGRLNLAGLVPPDDGSPVPDVRIGDLQVRAGRLSFTDQRGEAPVSKLLAPVTFELRDFATRADAGGGYKLDATSRAGEHFAWSGTLGLAPLASKGRFQVSELQLATIASLAGSQLPAKVDDGSVTLSGSYRFAGPARSPGKAPATILEVDIASLSAREAAFRLSGGDSVAIRSIDIAPTRLSLAGDTVAIGAIRLSGIALSRPTGERASIAGASLAASRYTIGPGKADIGALNAGNISLTGRGRGAATVTLAALAIAPSRLAAPDQRADIGSVTATGLRSAAAVSASNAFTIPGLYPLPPDRSKAGGTTGWTANIASFTLADAALRVAVARTAPALGRTFEIAPLTLKVGAIGSDMKQPLAIDLGASIDGKARLTATGTVAVANGSADLAVDLAGLDIAKAASLVEQRKVLVKGGTLAAKGRLILVGGGLPGFRGDAGIGNLDLRQRSNNGDLLKWARVDFSGIDYQPAPERLAIKRIGFDRPVSTVVFTREQQLNLAAVARDDDQAAPATSAPSAPAKTKLKVLAPVSNTLDAAGKLFPVRIDAVTVKRGTIAFADYSIDPNFAARIEGLEGKVSGLSTAKGSQAKFDLKGFVVDRFSPVTVTGRANPFAYDADTDLTASFRNIELPVFNPYSGRFAGYAIAKGKLSTTIHYRIVNRALDADHQIVIDQLTWGAATDSKQKVSLPVRLAASLLKDRRGVIDLDLPVKGTLDDPTFRIWPVIWKIVGNVLTRIVTAPFAAIGSLFGGGDKAQFIDFAPGSPTVPPEAAKSLAALAKGLAERPEVKLDIPAGSGIREDAEAMTRDALAAAIAGGKADALPLDKRLDRMKSLYKARFGRGPKYPDDTVEKAGLFAGGEAKTAARQSQAEWLEKQLLPKFAPSSAQLAALGQARADAVKAALLADGAIPPERVFVSTADTVTAKDGKVEMELKLQ